jgi:dephospho-CoA kinase
MLRVGLTGGLGSGKSTAAGIFASLGAYILQSDAIGRELMQPGETVHRAIAAHFGSEVVLSDGTLDRAALARIAFAEGRVEELNAIVHPAVIARQAALVREIGQKDLHAVVIVESALIFETQYNETQYSEANSGETEESAIRSASLENVPQAEPVRWHRRFDRIILVTAPDELKVARFVARIAQNKPVAAERRKELEDEAHRRLARQLTDDQKAAFADYILTNSGSVAELEWQIDRLWPILQAAALHTH